MDAREMKIWIYSGLTEAQYEDLQQAYEGDLKKINGARLMAMQELIGNDLRTTRVGEKLYLRVSSILANKGMIQPDWDGKLEDTAKAARLVNSGHVYLPRQVNIKLGSVHFKIMRTLGQDPGQSIQFLGSVYGMHSVMELAAAGLNEMHDFEGCKRWGWCTLDYKAIRMLEELDGRA